MNLHDQQAGAKRPVVRCSWTVVCSTSIGGGSHWGEEVESVIQADRMGGAIDEYNNQLAIGIDRLACDGGASSGNSRHVDLYRRNTLPGGARTD